MNYYLNARVKSLIAQKYEERPNPFTECSLPGQWYSKHMWGLIFLNGAQKENKDTKCTHWRHIHADGSECNFVMWLSGYFVWDTKRNKGFVFFLNESIMPNFHNNIVAAHEF